MNAYEDDDLGHYRTAGYAVCGMGGLSLVLALAATLSGAELGFIGPGGILGIALVFLVVGGTMARAHEER